MGSPQWTGPTGRAPTQMSSGGSPFRAPPSIPPSCSPPRMTRTSISATTCTGTTTSTEPYISTRNAPKQGWTAATRSFSATILGIWKPRPSASSKNTRTKPSPPGTPQSFFRLRSGNGPTRCGSRRSSTVWNHPREPSSTMMRISACGTTRCGWTPP